MKGMNKEIKLLEANCCIRCPHFFTRFALIYTSIPLEIDNKKKRKKKKQLRYYGLLRKLCKNI